MRQTFAELIQSATIDPTTRVLRIIASPASTPVEISVVYYRAGYTPSDYLTPADWPTRFRLERSLAIKCPSLPLQLAGGKKVQEVLTHPGVLEKYLGDLGPEYVDAVRASWMGMWGLDAAAAAAGGREGEDGISRARRQASSLVLKPQREGGGNNVYKEDIPAFLDALPSQERAAWIAMELIIPPEGASNYLVRADGIGSAVRTEVVSELGIFGWALFGNTGEEMREKEVGWLVRTKGKDSNEGGVAAGFSVLDSLVLIND